MNLNELIKEYRQASNLTQQELATKSNLSIATIRKYESGERIPKYSSLESLATIFNIPIDLLLDTKKYFEDNIQIYLNKTLIPIELKLLKSYGFVVNTDINTLSAPVFINEKGSTLVDYSANEVKQICEGEAWLRLFDLIDYVKTTSNKKDLMLVGKTIGELQPLFDKVYDSIELELLKILYTRGGLIVNPNTKK